MTTEYVVYNINTGDVVTHPVPREMAESICAENNNPAFAPRYAMRVVDFDYDELIETAHQDDLHNFAEWTQSEPVEEYERQWETSLHPWAWRGIALWFVVINVVGVVALWAR